jgi:hypothetical protein
MTTTINKISISGSSLNIEYKGGTPSPSPSPSGFCSQYSDGMCGGFKSCDVQKGPYDYNINFTKGYGTITTYSGAGLQGACSSTNLSKNCFNNIENDYVPVAVPWVWFNEKSNGNCKDGLYCNYNEGDITDIKGNKVCFKLSNIDDTSKFTYVIVEDKCDGNCPTNNSCGETCHETPCTISFNCYNASDRKSCYDPSTRCPIEQGCIDSPAMRGIDQKLVTMNNPTDLNKKYGIDGCCPTASSTNNIFGDWCSGFHVHFDMACGPPDTALTNPKFNRLCENAKTGGNCGIMYERVKCPE